MKKLIWIAFVEFVRLLQYYPKQHQVEPKGKSIFVYCFLFIRKAIARKGIENQPRKI